MRVRVSLAAPNVTFSTSNIYIPRCIKYFFGLKIAREIVKIHKFIIYLFSWEFLCFGAVSGFVDSKQVTQRRPMGVDFNSNGTKMFVVGTVENKIFEFDLTTGFDVSTATKNSNECDFAGIGSDVVDIEFN